MIRTIKGDTRMTLPKNDVRTTHDDFVNRELSVAELGAISAGLSPSGLNGSTTPLFKPPHPHKPPLSLGELAQLGLRLSTFPFSGGLGLF
jgi:hypothetical protein